MVLDERGVELDSAGIAQLIAKARRSLAAACPSLMSPLLCASLRAKTGLQP